MKKVEESFNLTYVKLVLSSTFFNFLELYVLVTVFTPKAEDEVDHRSSAVQDIV